MDHASRERWRQLLAAADVPSLCDRLRRPDATNYGGVYTPLEATSDRQIPRWRPLLRSRKLESNVTPLPLYHGDLWERFLSLLLVPETAMVCWPNAGRWVADVKIDEPRSIYWATHPWWQQPVLPDALQRFRDGYRDRILVLGMRRTHDMPETCVLPLDNTLTRKERRGCGHPFCVYCFASRIVWSAKRMQRAVTQLLQALPPSNGRGEYPLVLYGFSHHYAYTFPTANGLSMPDLVRLMYAERPLSLRHDGYGMVNWFLPCLRPDIGAASFWHVGFGVCDVDDYYPVAPPAETAAMYDGFAIPISRTVRRLPQWFYALAALFQLWDPVTTPTIPLEAVPDMQALERRRMFHTHRTGLLWHKTLSPEKVKRALQYPKNSRRPKISAWQLYVWQRNRYRWGLPVLDRVRRPSRAVPGQPFSDVV